MASGEITVTVERAVHDGLRDLAQRVFEQHGVQLHAAQIDWLDISSLGIQREVISSIRISTETKAPNVEVQPDAQGSLRGSAGTTGSAARGED